LLKFLSVKVDAVFLSLQMSTLLSLSQHPPILSLEDWMQNPLPHTEWVNGKLVEKDGMTLRHSEIQARLANKWLNFAESIKNSGSVYTEVPCRTQKQGRYPDVAYLTPELVRQYGQETVLPQSFPLCAEIISPTDLAEEVIAKAQEYLQSGGQEVWLVFPDHHWVIVVTPTARMVFVSGEVVSTQAVLLGFSIAVDELLS
jgi:Uma2 family endonuclease